MCYCYCSLRFFMCSCFFMHSCVCVFHELTYFTFFMWSRLSCVHVFHELTYFTFFMWSCFSCVHVFHELPYFTFFMCSRFSCACIFYELPYFTFFTCSRFSCAWVFHELSYFTFFTCSQFSCACVFTFFTFSCFHMFVLATNIGFLLIYFICTIKHKNYLSNRYSGRSYVHTYINYKGVITKNNIIIALCFMRHMNYHNPATKNIRFLLSFSQSPSHFTKMLFTKYPLHSHFMEIHLQNTHTSQFMKMLYGEYFYAYLSLCGYASEEL